MSLPGVYDRLRGIAKHPGVDRRIPDRPMGLALPRAGHEDVRILRPEQVVHPLGRDPTEGRADMAVRVEGQADLRMAELLHDDARRDALAEHCLLYTSDAADE